MKIEYRKGDLFKTDCKCIVHGCNAQGVMGAGVAKIIRERYPKAYERYRNEYELHQHLKLGTLVTVPCEDRIIINAITQDSYGNNGSRYVSYDAVSECMKRIDRHYELYGTTEVAMPKIGAGLAGGDWNVIAAIIESELKTVKPIVYEL